MKKIVLLLAGIGCSVIAIVLVGMGFFSVPEPTGPPERITVGQPPLEQSALIYTADEQGFFSRHGLSVGINDSYPNGVLPVQDLADGKIDIAVSAEYPVLAAIARGENLTIIGVIDRYQNEKLLVRNDRGITNVSDLAGKRIGYPKGTIVEFFLGRFLEIHGMGQNEVILVPLQVSEVANAIADGDVDAVAYYQPHVAAIEERMGRNVTAWPLQSNQHLYGVLSVRRDWAATHPDLGRRFLLALGDAENYANSHPAAFRRIVEKRLNLTGSYADEIWPDHHVSLSLDQSLVLAMEDEARWMAKNNLTGKDRIPNVLHYIDTSGMKSVKPGSVDIAGVTAS